MYRFFFSGHCVLVYSVLQWQVWKRICLIKAWRVLFQLTHWFLAGTPSKHTRLTAQGPRSRNRPSRSRARSRCTWLRRTWKTAEVRGQLCCRWAKRKPKTKGRGGSRGTADGDGGRGGWSETGGSSINTANTLAPRRTCLPWVRPLGCHFAWVQNIPAVHVYFGLCVSCTCKVTVPHYFLLA